MKVLSRIGWFGRQSLGLAGNLAMNPVSTLRAAKLAWKNGAGRTAGNFLSDANLLARSLAVGPSPMMAMDTSALKGELKPFSVEESVVDAGRERKFVVTNDKGEILAPRTDVADALNLKLISVSSDQKTYWPNEKVNLAILLPGRPNAEVEVTLTKKDGAPVELGKHTVDENGVLSLVVMNGEEDPLGLGEYTINVKTVDKTISAEAVISVVEGTLGALSFGHTWAELKGDEEELPPGYWYLVGRRGGRAGDRWGHGMNVGNIIMDEGKPYNGEVTINVRCYLPQCNGVEAAPAQKVNIEDGVLKTVLNTDYHSGPFEIEIITEKGSIRHLFGQSGHVERNMVNISEGLGNQFRAGISPYEGTTAVDGRSVYYEKAETEDAALLLESPVADASSRTRLVAQSVIEDLKIFVHIPNPDGTFKVQELSDLPKTVQKGEVIEVPVVGPYSTIVVAGNKVAGKDKKFFEGYSLVFTPGQLAVQIDAPSQSSPMAEVALGVRTINPITGAPLTSSGILTVFDTRVESPEATGPLTSALGRSFRDGAETLGELEDTLGFGRYMNEDLMDFDDDDGGMEVFGLTGGSDRSLGGYGIRDSGVRHFSGGGGPVLRRMAFLSAGAPTLGGGYAGRGGDFDSEEIPAEEGELREGTQKVVYSERISTGPDGFVKIKIALGPQTGRYRAAFSAVKGTEFAKGSAQVDATLPASVEAPLPKFLVDGARVEARVIVNNSTGGEVTLRITGAGLMAPVIKKLSGEREEVPVTLISGRPDDKLLMEIIGADQKVIDSRQLTIGNVSNQKATTSRLVISDGDTPVSVAPGERAAVFRNVGQMLSGILRNMITTTESWFPHAEAVTADAAVKAQLLKAIELGIIDSESETDHLVNRVRILVQDIADRFLDETTGLLVPYPGMEDPNPLWSAWAARNLQSVVSALDNTKIGTQRLAKTLELAKGIVKRINTTLVGQGADIIKMAGYDPNNDNKGMIAIPVADGVEHKIATDSSVVELVAGKANLANLYKKSGKDRQLNAYSRVGEVPHLIELAKAAWLAGEGQRAKFYDLFASIATWAVRTKEPAMIAGPALLGGVYHNPQSMIRFLELLVMMGEEKAKSGRPDAGQIVKIDGQNMDEKKLPADAPVNIDKSDQGQSVRAPKFAAVLVEGEKEINLQEKSEGPAPRPFVTVSAGENKLSVGQRTSLEINLDQGKDPLEYQAFIVVPSTVSIHQTDDILLDYTGRAIHGQRAVGGEKVQMMAVPFRGSRSIKLAIEGAQKGTSPGMVLVRHMHDPNDTQTVKIGDIEVS